MVKALDEDAFTVYYHELEGCMCGAYKPRDSAMCEGCRQHLRDTQPALLHVIENGTGDPLLQAMGEFRELVRGAQ